MTNEEVFSELQELLKELSIEVKYGRGYFEGGLCRYKDGKFIYLNRSQNMESHITIILSELRNLDLDGMNFSLKVKNLLKETESN